MMRIMISSTEKFNQNYIHLSFVNDEGKIIPEYIPHELNRMEKWVHNFCTDIRFKRGAEHHYGHYRYLLPAYYKKIEDLRFIIHVLEIHDGQPDIVKEKKDFNYLTSLYQHEYNHIILPIHKKKKSKSGAEDPYIDAYFEKWVHQETNIDWRRLYHGVSSQEFIELIQVKAEEIKQLEAKLFPEQT